MTNESIPTPPVAIQTEIRERLIADCHKVCPSLDPAGKSNEQILRETLLDPRDTRSWKAADLHRSLRSRLYWVKRRVNV